MCGAGAYSDNILRLACRYLIPFHHAVFFYGTGIVQETKDPRSVIYRSLGSDIHMASVMSNPLINTGRRHKKKSLHQIQGGQNQTTQMINTRWRTATEQHNYSSKLLQALRHVRITPSSATRGGRAIRQTADRVLAMTAKGRTRWSRAMLTNRLKLKFLKAKKPKLVSLSRTRKPRVINVVCHRAVQKKALVLGNLVPGCRKQPLPVILEEAHDYISALEMQVRAMTALAELLSVAGAVSSSLSSPPS